MSIKEEILWVISLRHTEPTKVLSERIQVNSRSISVDLAQYLGARYVERHLYGRKY